jgi:hypothetical protein
VPLLGKKLKNLLRLGWQRMEAVSVVCRIFSPRLSVVEASSCTWCSSSFKTNAERDQSNVGMLTYVYWCRSTSRFPTSWILYLCIICVSIHRKLSYVPSSSLQSSKDACPTTTYQYDVVPVRYPGENGLESRRLVTSTSI